MAAPTQYKVIQNSPKEVEAELNALAKKGWRPIAMGGPSIGLMVAVILEKKGSWGQSADSSIPS